MESGLPGWTLSGGAAVVAGDDGLGVRAGRKVLSAAGRRDGGHVADLHRQDLHARAPARAQHGGVGLDLDVDVLYTDTKGKSVVQGSRATRSTRGLGADSDFDINARLDGAAPVQFRFTAPKNSGWLVDDFYVDPRARG